MVKKGKIRRDCGEELGRLMMYYKKSVKKLDGSGHYNAGYTGAVFPPPSPLTSPQYSLPPCTLYTSSPLHFSCPISQTFSLDLIMN